MTTTCAAGSTCVNGICLLNCTSDAQCGQGFACDPVNKVCSWPCNSTTNPCPGNAPCVAGKCLTSCTTTADCAAGLTCQGGVCRIPVQIFYQQKDKFTPSGCVVPRDGSGTSPLNPAGSCTSPSAQWGLVPLGPGGGTLYNATSNCYANFLPNGYVNCTPTPNVTTPFTLAIGPGGSSPPQNYNQQTLVVNIPAGQGTAAGTYCLGDEGNAGQNTNLNVCDITANGGSTIGFYATYGCPASSNTAPATSR